MLNRGCNVSLKPLDDDSFAITSNYRVIYLKDALDSLQVIDAIKTLGYTKK